MSQITKYISNKTLRKHTCKEPLHPSGLKYIVYDRNENEISITIFGLFYMKERKLDIEINELIISGIISIDEERVFIVTYNGNAFVFDVNSLQLSLIARFSGNVMQNCYVDKNLARIYVQTNNYLYVLDYNMQIVNKHLVKNVLFFERFVAHGDMLFINSNNRLFIYDRKREVQQCCFETETLISTNVAICKEKCVVLSFNHIDCFSLDTKEILWSLELCETQRFQLAPVVYEDKLIVACPGGKIIIIKCENGSILKEYKFFSPVKEWWLENAKLYINRLNNSYRVLCFESNKCIKIKLCITDSRIRKSYLKRIKSECTNNMREHINEELLNLLKQAYFSRIAFRARKFPSAINKFEAIDITCWMEERYHIELGTEFIYCLEKKEIEKAINIFYNSLNCSLKNYYLTKKESGT